MENPSYTIFHLKDKYIKPQDFHSHEEIEFYIFIDGNVIYNIEENVYELMPFDILIIPPGEMHRPVLENSNIAYERIVLSVPIFYLRELFSNSFDTFTILINSFLKKEHIIKLTATDFNVFYDILHNIILYSKKENNQNKLIANSYLIIFLLQLYKKQLQIKETEIPFKKNIVSDVILYINENLSENLNLDFLSKKFYISKYHLLRKFKEYTNTTIGDYITTKRINLAKQYIMNGNSTTLAAEKSGFNNYSNFYKAFIKYTNIKPSEFKITNF